MITVSLKNTRFIAHHGLYEEEGKTGNEFDIDLSVWYKPGKKKIKGIGDTIDYVRLHKLVKDEMDKPHKLLETLAIEISRKIKAEFLHIREIEIVIRKVNPPILNFTGSVAVTYRKQF